LELPARAHVPAMVKTSPDDNAPLDPEEDNLEEGLDETFPASDPPAPVQPPKPGNPEAEDHAAS